MDGQTAAILNKVLRCEMTAVNQQFIHVLALRDWGEAETAARVMEVDCVDFPNAMRILDYLVETETPISLAAERVAPGTDYGGILRAEQAIERRLSAALDGAAGADGRAGELIATAKAPRAAYAAWLNERLDGPKRDEAAAAPPAAAAGVIAHLIAMIEQAMVHAFVHWHRGDAGDADAAWATSGAAMMHMTAFVHLFAARKSVPVPGTMPPLQISGRPAEAQDFDRRLAELCAGEAAKEALRCQVTEIADRCGEVADYYEALSRWQPKERHPAADRNPAAFSSFEATLSRFVRR